MNTIVTCDTASTFHHDDEIKTCFAFFGLQRSTDCLDLYQLYMIRLEKIPTGRVTVTAENCVTVLPCINKSSTLSEFYKTNKT